MYFYDRMRIIENSTLVLDSFDLQKQQFHMVQSTLNAFIFALVLRQIRTNLKTSSSLTILKHLINTFAFFSSDF